MVEMVAACGVALALDQWSKHFVRTSLPHEGLTWKGLVRIRYIINSRPAFLSVRTPAVMTGTWFLALLAILFLHHYGGWFLKGSALSGLGLALGGAAGNLLDIFRLRHVADFVDLGWWPVFNAADVAIVGGLALAFWPRI